eukprot:CAMPEP_0180784474 /NCGR_PEP_ID=MMETSP1038_2-20121128/49624_1 /TAXON_ID=632150 /ORGANISM="Azadinium spinosum, Strain 3D9" /LENGTH=169 /DNA_ID=CAMNT_0022821207 /DNA_START=23 /DNA_END=529 /DNA_ORIENTATION=-
MAMCLSATQDTQIWEEASEPSTGVPDSLSGFSDKDSFGRRDSRDSVGSSELAGLEDRAENGDGKPRHVAVPPSCRSNYWNSQRSSPIKSHLLERRRAKQQGAGERVTPNLNVDLWRLPRWSSGHSVRLVSQSGSSAVASPVLVSKALRRNLGPPWQGSLTACMCGVRRF